ncbi:MAG TPA: hypothetical protein VF919_18595 [Gemmatimonadales bacterium]
MRPPGDGPGKITLLLGRRSSETRAQPAVNLAGRVAAAHSQPVEILPKAVRLDVAGTTREIANDYVWVFAGGTPPREFLEKAGIQVGPRDLTAEAGAEAKLVSGSRRLAG